MSEQEFALRFDKTHCVIVVAFGRRVTKDIYLAAYEALKRVIAARGPCSTIVDFTAVSSFELTQEFLREIAFMVPAVPSAMARIVVAPQPLVYGCCRVVETLRTETAAPIKVVRSLDEAYAGFGAVAKDFAAIDVG